MTPPRVTLVLPAFNEAARLAGALDELFGYLDGNPELRERVDVLVVDDGSTDGTLDIVTRRPEASSAGGAAGRADLAGGPARLTGARVPPARKGAAVRAG